MSHEQASMACDMDVEGCEVDTGKADSLTSAVGIAGTPNLMHVIFHHSH